MTRERKKSTKKEREEQIYWIKDWIKDGNSKGEEAAFIVGNE